MPYNANYIAELEMKPMRVNACVVAQRSLSDDCKKTALTTADCDDVTTMTSLKDVHLLALPCNHVPVRLAGRGAST